MDKKNLQKIIIIGKAGSGKTTLSKKLSSILNIKFINLDELFWMENSNWEKVDNKIFIERVDKASEGDSWIIDGNHFSKIQDILWPRATHIIWLDYPLIIALKRLIFRIIKRTIFKKDLLNNNKENLFTHLFTKDSMIKHLLSQNKKHKNIENIIKEYKNIELIKIKNQKELDIFIKNLE